MDTFALVTIACMSTIAGIAGIAVLIDMFGSHKADLSEKSKSGRVKKIRLLKNSVYTVEELIG